MEGIAAAAAAAAESRQHSNGIWIDDLDDEEEEGVYPADVLEGRKRGDGSIYRPDAYQLHKLYRIADRIETCLEPMRLTHPNEECYPCPANCKQHGGCNMMQIYFFKLSKLPPAATTAGCSIQVYGFMAIRDLLDPFRNYVFNRTRDDPFIIQDPHSDPFIYTSGPKRGVYFQCTVLIEYDMKIKVGEDVRQDLPLIDGVVTLDELTWNQGPSTYRIRGDSGGAAVDFSQALIRGAVEATVEVSVTRIAQQHGIDLSICGVLPPRTGEIKLFRGLDDEPRALNRFVIAVGLTSDLFLLFKDASGKTGKFAFRATPHGCITEHQNFDFATIEVKVTWSNLH